MRLHVCVILSAGIQAVNVCISLLLQHLQDQFSPLQHGCSVACFSPCAGRSLILGRLGSLLCLIGTLNSLFQLRVPRQPKNNSGVEMKMTAANVQLKLSSLSR